MKKNKFEDFWKNATDAEWDEIEKDRNTMDATAFSAKYGAKPESVRIYCLMHFHEKEKYEARTAELQKEIDALKNKVKATRAKQKDIIHLVPGTAYKARIYATEETFAAFTEMANKVSEQTGMKKYTAVALMLEEATKLFGKLFE